MSVAEIRKALVAAAAVIAAGAPFLAEFANVLPRPAAIAIFAVVAVAGIYGVWRLPNATPAQKAAGTVASLRELQDRIRRVEARGASAVVATPAPEPTVTFTVRPPTAEQIDALTEAARREAGRVADVNRRAAIEAGEAAGRTVAQLRAALEQRLTPPAD